MAHPILCRMPGDPPPPGMCKLRIRSNGNPQDTRVYAVDDQGVEREILGVLAVDWKLDGLNEMPTAQVTTCESDVELDAPIAEVVPETRQRRLINELRAALDKPIKPTPGAG